MYISVVIKSIFLISIIVYLTNHCNSRSFEIPHHQIRTTLIFELQDPSDQIIRRLHQRLNHLYLTYIRMHPNWLRVIKNVSRFEWKWVVNSTKYCVVNNTAHLLLRLQKKQEWENINEKNASKFCIRMNEWKYPSKQRNIEWKTFYFFC